jgi:Icc-related predicted phosphoesterase
MKILYTTDLHGNQHYYNLTWKKAVEHKVDMIINGGDLLPKINPIFKRQPRFIKNLERQYFPKIEKAGIHYLCCMGNDDLRIYDDQFDQACNQFEFIHNIAQRKFEIGGLEFIGMNYVSDYPFELKDRCRMDKKGFVFPIQNGPGCFSSEGGHLDNIEDWVSLAQSLPTIEDELKALPRPKDMKKAVYVIHMPPAGLGLDVCSNRNRPASKAVFDFILDEQPLLSLHGHIHESYIMTGIWKAPLGETICVQPGQGGMHPVFVLIDTNTMEMKRHGHGTGTRD